MEKNKVALASDLMLASVALIWGLGFPVTQMAIDANLSSGLIVALRFLIAALVMGIIFRKEVRTITARDALLGCVAGLIIGMAFLLQVMGQSMTTPSNSAFLTSLNVIIVPFLSWAFFHQRPTRKMLLVALGCLVGALVLTITPGQGLQLGFGDLLVLCCAVAFSLHISYLGWVAGRIDVKKLTFLQMLTAGCLGSIYTLVFELPQIAEADFAVGWAPILYMALLSTAFAFFAQTYAQKHTSPARAAIILGCEGLLGSIFSVLLGYEPVTINLVVGGTIIFLSLLLMEVNPAALLRRRPADAEQF